MPPRDVTVLVVAMVILGLAIWGGAGRWSPRVTRSLGLLIALVGGFYLYVVLAPATPTSAGVACGLFVGSAVLFRLLSTFEQ
jgi:hypothetical protein